MSVFKASEKKTEDDHSHDILSAEDSDEVELEDDYFYHFIEGDVVEDVRQGSGGSFNISENQLECLKIVPTPRQLEDNIGDMVFDLEDDELHEDYVSDEEENKKLIKNIKYNPTMMSKDFEFKLGMEFTSIEEFKKAVKEYCLIHGYDIKFLRNEKHGCRIICKKKCGWLIFASGVGDSLTYMLKTYNPKHYCRITFASRLASSEWIAEKIVPHVKMNKNMKLADVVSTIREGYMAQPSINKAYRARKLARKMVEGDHIEEYHVLRDYCNEIKERMPGSTFCLVTDRPYVDQPLVFRRLYQCLEPIKRGFKSACRPIIGLDGCFLKGQFGGILLVALARDPNDQYFPLAVAVVESESRDSWTWFLQNLLEDIGSMAEKRWVFISDQQKGLVQTFEHLLEGAEHRYCVRHLYANIKSRYGGGTIIRDLVIRAVKATYKRAWEEQMMQLKNVSKEAYDHLMSFKPSCWTKSHFSEYSKCDMIMNNISESFNGRLLEARELSIISLLDWIRAYLMTRFVENRIKAAKYRDKGRVCPRPRKRLDKEVEGSKKWIAIEAGNDLFEVSCNSHRFSVDLKLRSCECNWWQLTGIPCRHAVSCIYAKQQDPHNYVDAYLTIEKYADCYSPVLQPINGKDMWVRTNLEPNDPPVYHKRPGRPTKKRKKEKDEPLPKNKLRRSNITLKCKLCGKKGHNRRTCSEALRQALNASSQATCSSQLACSLEGGISHP